MRRTQRWLTLITLYDLLGVARNVDAADLKRAWRTMTRVTHPDRNPDCQEPAGYLTTMVNNAG